MTKLSMILTVVITLLLIQELFATPVKHKKRRMKRSMDWCNLNIMGCALYFTHIIPFRLHFDVIRFLDTHVTGRQDYIEDREIEGDLLMIIQYVLEIQGYILNTSYLTDSYISFTLDLESGQNLCSNRSIRSSTYGKKNISDFPPCGSHFFKIHFTYQF